MESARDRRQRPRRPYRRLAAHTGFTLTELVVSLGIMAVLLVGLASAMLLVGQAVPDPSSPAMQTLDSAMVGQQMLEELAAATFFFQHAARVVEFTVADRNNDKAPEVIRYQWSGVQGDPLMRYYNGAGPVAVIPELDDLQLAYELASTSESYSGAVIFGSETQLMNQSTGLLPSAYALTPTAALGQYMLPSLPADAIGWRPTRVVISARSSGKTDGVISAQLRGATAAKLPKSTVLAEVTILESSLPGAVGWVDVAFPNVQMLGPTEAVCLLLLGQVGGGNIADVEHYTLLGTGKLTSNNGGSSWTFNSVQGTRFDLFGKSATQGPPQQAGREYVTGVSVMLQPSGGPPIFAETNTLNVPELRSYEWLADFSTPPTADFNGDGVADWATCDGSPFVAGAIKGDVWTVAQAIETQPGCDFNRLTTIEVGARSRVAGVEVELSGDVDRSGGTAAWLYASMVLEADNTQTLAVWQALSETTRERLHQVRGLPFGIVNYRLLIDPAYGTVNLSVEGQDKGTAVYTRISALAPRRAVVLRATEANKTEIDYVRIRVAE